MLSSASSNHLSLGFDKSHANSDSALMGLSKLEKTLLSMVELNYLEVVGVNHDVLQLTDAGMKYMLRKYQDMPIEFTRSLGFARNPDNIGKVTLLAVDNLNRRAPVQASGVESMTTEMNYQFDGEKTEDRVLDSFNNYFGARGEKAEDDIEI